MKIAVDAMGGDHAPEAIVEGCVQAAEEYGFSLILVGQEDRIRQELAKYRTDHLSIEVKHASQIVEMHDLPSFALRRKKDSSIHVAIKLIKNGEADAFVSAGNTGAVMAISKLTCRMLPGIDRPALATVLPNINGVTVMVDVGANVDCKGLHLLQFAVMGHIYAKEVFGIATPRIGLLSIGEEASKGNVLTKEVFEPLSESKLNFIGNAEGRDVFSGRVDVVVCDGFIGNVVLKVSESLAKTIGTLLKEAFSKNWLTKLGYLLVKPGMKLMSKRVDYTEYGGAPLLGLNGVVIISHGSSKAKAIKNAIRVTAESVNHHINEQIIDTLTQCEFDTKSRAKAASLWRHLKETIRHEEKHAADKKKEAALKQPEQHSTSEEKSQKVDDHEAKKSWWNLRQRNESEKEDSDIRQQSDFHEREVAADQVCETDPIEDSAEQHTPTEHDKKHWWNMKRHNQKASDTHGEEMLGEEPVPVADITESQEPADNEDAAPSKESEHEKNIWGKLKELTHTEDHDEGIVSESPAAEKSSDHKNASLPRKIEDTPKATISEQQTPQKKKKSSAKKE